MAQTGKARPGPAGGTRVFCILPAELAPKLHDLLRAHFARDDGIDVIVERRSAERRARPERRANARAANDGAPASRADRRIAERRGIVLPVAHMRELPRSARRYAEQILFVERLEPSSQQAEDVDTARLVARFKAGDHEVFTTLYLRYFDRVYGYLRVALKDAHEAEDATQQVFIQVFQGLPRYERRAQPFRAWLFTIVRNCALGQLRKQGRLELVDPNDLQERHERRAAADLPLTALEWISDRDLFIFTERLPLAQRQVLVLRYMLDLTDSEIAAVLGRTPVDVRTLQHRALTFLRARLAAVGRTSVRHERAPWQRRVRQAPVLRQRRFAIARPPGRSV